jgi:hypothetical protein
MWYKTQRLLVFCVLVIHNPVFLALETHPTHHTLNLNGIRLPPPRGEPLAATSVPFT